MIKFFLLFLGALVLSCTQNDKNNSGLDGQLENHMVRFDYLEALDKSFLFYEAQADSNPAEAGSVKRLTWTVETGLKDGKAPQYVSDDTPQPRTINNPPNLSGGWFDGGDYVKFGLPMSYSATMLVWSFITSKDVYDSNFIKEYEASEIATTAQMSIGAYGRSQIWNILNYLGRTYDDNGTEELEDDVFYYQVADGDMDHNFTGLPQEWNSYAAERGLERKAYFCDLENGCSNVAGGTAAALASGYVLALSGISS